MALTDLIPGVGWIKTNIAAVLGGALALSCLGNVSLGFLAKHYSEQVQECKSATKTANKTATEKKIVVETRQRKVVHESSNRVNSRIAGVRDVIVLPPRVQHDSRVGDSPKAAPSPGTTDGASPAPVLYEVSESDIVTCTVNTIKAEEWQKFYKSIQDIWEEENVGQADPKSNSVPSQ